MLTMLKGYSAILVKNGKGKVVNEWVAAEAAYELFLDNRRVETIVVSPAELKAHAVGFIVTEGMAQPEQIESVREEGRHIFVNTKDHVSTPADRTLWRSSAYRGSEEGSINPVTSNVAVDTEVIVQCAQQILRQATNWEKTGGLHISLLFDVRGELVAVAEDIGRHNSVDKVVGYAVLHDVPLTETILACSGRQPEGMVLKAARARIPIVVTKAAVTDRGIETAEHLGVTLIGFARDDRFTIYCHPERIQGVSGEDNDGSSNSS